MSATSIVAALGEQAPLARRGQRPRLQILVLLVAVAAVAFLCPALANALVYDRTAILDGQWWRLLTGHLVHFSPTHLLYDTLVVGVTGWLIERQGRRQLVLLVGLTAMAISAAVFVIHPEVRCYGGLSGIAFATTGYLALLGLTQEGARRWLLAAVLVLMAGKIGWECVTGRTLLASVNGFVVLPTAHAVGAACGVGWWILNHERK